MVATLFKTKNPKLPVGPTLRKSGLSLENLESRLLMYADATMEAEHEQVAALVPDSAVTYKSVETGRWADPATWQHQVKDAQGNSSFVTDGTTPGVNDNVVISADTTVTIDTLLDKTAAGARNNIHTIRDDGTLDFDAHSNTSLLVDTMIVSPDGNLNIGTAADPVDALHSAKIIFADNGDIDTAWDPYQYSRGLVSEGAVSIAGSEVTSFVQYDPHLAKGATSVTLTSIPTGWKVGDQLVIPSMNFIDKNTNNADDQVTISAINGDTISFSQALTYDHPAGTSYISDVTRNVSFSSESVAMGDNTILHRGHVMFMHNDDVHVDAVGFYGLGRTDKSQPIDDPVLVPDPDHPGQMTTDVISPVVNSIDGTHRVYVPVVDANGNPEFNPDGTPKLQIAKTGLNPRGRYAVHFHHTCDCDSDGCDCPPDTLNDSAVVDSPGWGVVNHSSNVDITNNVVFDVTGACYVTEAGDEQGSFVGNIAIDAKGSGLGVEDRQANNDFGHDGDGFWLQGPNVTIANNVVANVVHAGFVLFGRGLVQPGLGATQIAASDLADPSLANGQAFVDVGDVPMRQFSGNTVFAANDGFESWLSLNDIHDGSRRNVIQDFTAFDIHEVAINLPYVGNMTIINANLTNNINNPNGYGIMGNTITHDIEYDNCNIQGFRIGISVAVSGNNVVNGGTFADLSAILIPPLDLTGRTVDINDTAANPMTFINLSAAALAGRTQYDIDTVSKYDPTNNDLTKDFDPDVVKMDTVRYNGKQLYYKQQAADFIPFQVGSAPSYVPPQLLGKTNQQLWDMYGLAIGGAVAPKDATASDPRINALIGNPITYAPTVTLTSAKFAKLNTLTPYVLTYKYYNPADPTAGKDGFVTVTDPHVALNQGWNVITRNIMGQVRSLLVYGDGIPPTFQFFPMVTTINAADIYNGAVFVINGYVMDDSNVKEHYFKTINLNDPKYVTPIETRADGSRFVTVSFSVSDPAGNSSIITLDLTVTDTATLQKDLGRSYAPTIAPSATLTALLRQLNPIQMVF